MYHGGKIGSPHIPVAQSLAEGMMTPPMPMDLAIFHDGLSQVGPGRQTPPCAMPAASDDGVDHEPVGTDGHMQESIRLA